MPLIANIQRFSIHDGAGIRQTVFFKGCPLRCAWCHNPECQSFLAEWMLYPERCIGCGHCEQSCPTGARERVGETYTVDALTALLLRDRPFYEVSGGGVTLSGGEVMAQDGGYLLELCRRLTRQGVCVSIDTSGYATYERFLPLLPYVDTFLYDIKAFDSTLHARYTGVDNALILENAARLCRDGARLNIRVPVVPEVNGHESEMSRIVAFARDHLTLASVNLLPYHRLGQEKGTRLNPPVAPSAFTEPTAEQMLGVAELWKRAGFLNITIGG